MDFYYTGAICHLVSFLPASKSPFTKLEEVQPDPADAHKIWWPLDRTSESVDFIRQPNEVCYVTLKPRHKDLDINIIMECFEVRLLSLIFILIIA